MTKPRKLTESELLMIHGNAKWEAERVGAPGSPVRERAVATVALVERVRHLEAERAKVEALLQNIAGGRVGLEACQRELILWTRRPDMLGETRPRCRGASDCREDGDAVEALLAAYEKMKERALELGARPPIGT